MLCIQIHALYTDSMYTCFVYILSCFVYLNLIYTKICNAGTELIFLHLIPYEFLKKLYF